MFFTLKECKREKGTLIDRIKRLGEKIDELPEWMINVIDWFRDIPDKLRAIPDWFRDLWDKIKEIPGNIADFFRGIFKK